MIKSLIITNCQNITDEGFLSLKASEVQHLVIVWHSITDKELQAIAERFPLLESLQFEGKAFSDIGLFALTHCSQLKRLDIEGSDVLTPEGVLAFVQHSLSLESLIIEHCRKISQKLTDEIGKLAPHLNIYIH